MANTYTQLYYHVVFVVKRRRNLIQSKWKTELYKYIVGIVNNKNHKIVVINGMPDHIHILLRAKPDINLSHIMRDIKANSSRYINQRKWVRGKFEWQVGFAAFTVGYSQVDMVINYIERQEEHHIKQSFRQEYISFLKDNGIAYDTQYIFDEVE